MLLNKNRFSLINRLFIGSSISFFHNSSLLLSDINKDNISGSAKVDLEYIQLEDRLSKLRFTENESIDDNTKTQLVEELIYKTTNVDINNDSMIDKDGFIISDSSNKMSSYEESFPNLLKEIKSDMDIAESLGSIVKQDSNILYMLLQKTGILGFYDRMRSNDNTASLVGLKEKLEEISSNINNLTNKISELKTDNTDENYYKIDKLTAHKNLQESVDKIGDIVDFYSKHHNFFELGFKASLLISPFFAYTKLLNNHIANSMPTDAPSYKKAKYQEIVKLRAKTIRSFNEVAIPLLGIYYLGLISVGQINSHYSMPKYNELSLSLIPLLKKKKDNLNSNHYKIILIPIVISICSYIIPKMIYYISPSLYLYLAELISIHTYWSLYLFLFVIFVGFIKNILEFYLFMLYRLDKNNIKINQNLPSFVLTWIKETEELSKISMPRLVFNMYMRILSYFAIIIIITLSLLIYLN
jgi:hypothetical protein